MCNLNKLYYLFDLKFASMILFSIKFYKEETMSGLGIAILVVVGILFVVFLVASGVRSYANRITRWFNWKKLAIDKPISEYTRLLLDENGLEDVEVVRAKWYNTLFIGNTYKVKTKTIRLSWLTGRRPTATHLASACRLVGLAKMHEEGVKGVRALQANRWIQGFPILMLPLIIIGLVVDLIVTKSVGTVSLVFAIVGFAFTLFPFIYAIAVAKVEFRALNEGQEIILGMGLLDESEEKKMKKLFSAWKHLYRINALFNSFEIIYFVLYGIVSVVAKGVFKR